MSNIYGVANPMPSSAIWQTAGPGGDVSCPSATETTYIAANGIAAITPGNYYPLVLVTVSILLGATAPSALVLAAKIGAGSDFDTYTVNPVLLVNNATISVSVPLLGSNSASAWNFNGSNINITANPTGQTVTVKGAYTRAVVLLRRGPD